MLLALPATPGVPALVLPPLPPVALCVMFNAPVVLPLRMLVSVTLAPVPPTPLVVALPPLPPTPVVVALTVPPPVDEPVTPVPKETVPPLPAFPLVVAPPLPPVAVAPTVTMELLLFVALA